MAVVTERNIALWALAKGGGLPSYLARIPVSGRRRVVKALNRLGEPLGANLFTALIVCPDVVADLLDEDIAQRMNAIADRIIETVRS